MTRIFLIGYMGAGKTTLGKAFAREMSLNFIDLDWFIESPLRPSCQIPATTASCTPATRTT